METWNIFREEHNKVIVHVFMHFIYKLFTEEPIIAKTKIRYNLLKISVTCIISVTVMSTKYLILDKNVYQ